MIMDAAIIGVLSVIVFINLFTNKNDVHERKQASENFILNKIAKQVGVEETPLDKNLKRLIAQGKKNQAIKELRNSSRLGLKEAKDYMDKLTDTNLILNKIAKQVGVPETSLDENLKELVAHGNKIQAIKELRKYSGLGLKEAKDYVDNL